MPGDGKPDTGVLGDRSGQVWILKHLFCFVLWKLLQQFPQIAGLDLNPLEQWKQDLATSEADPEADATVADANALNFLFNSLILNFLFFDPLANLSFRTCCTNHRVAPPCT